MSQDATHNGLTGIVVVLLVLTVFGAYVGFASNGSLAAGENQMLAQGSCKSPFPPRPANTQTALKNGTVKVTKWLAVLLMPENETGQVCIKYTNYLNNVFQSQVNAGVDNVNVIKQGNTIGEISSPTSMPNISSSLSNIYLYLNSSQIVSYTIGSGSGTKGIYDVATLQSCPGTPLAVGYQKQELNASDFTYFLQNFFGCYIDLSTAMVGVTNIQVAYVPIYSNYTLNYNIANSSVVSVNPSPRVQNVTFNLGIQTYASPIRVSLDSSGLVSFSQDPDLSKLSNNSCTWYPNNNQAVEGMASLLLPDNGVVTVHAPSVSIQPYTVFNYSLSIQLANLSKSYYYALGPAISITSPGGNYSAAQSIAAYYPVNIGRSDFGGSASQLLSGSC